MKSRFLFLVLLFFSHSVLGQGFYNHVWLLGSYNFLQSLKGRMIFDSTSYVHTTENRKMPFKGTEATICDVQGNFLMSTNGIWIANANNDTMLNGSGLNPSSYTSQWAFGLPMTANTLFLPTFTDTNIYFLIHHTSEPMGSAFPAFELLLSKIEMNFDNGLGAVTQKNISIFQDTFYLKPDTC